MKRCGSWDLLTDKTLIKFVLMTIHIWQLSIIGVQKNMKKHTKTWFLRVTYLQPFLIFLSLYFGLLL